MRFIARVGILLLGLYILLTLGLLEILGALLINAGIVIVHIFSINPVAASIIALMFIMMGGSSLIDKDRRRDGHRH